jgi:hypothetical protein
MEEFSTYIFKENEIKTSNSKVIRERTYYVGILIFLIGVILFLFDLELGKYLMVSGFIIYTIGQIVLSGREPSIGYRPLILKLRRDSVFIGKERVEIKNKSDIEIKVIGYKGQLINQREAFYLTHNGNENLMKVRYGDIVSEFQFVLESEHHKDKLVKFCRENDFEID